MNLVDELHAIAAVLEAAGVTYAVCGGVAVTMHGATRSTKDIDLLVREADVARVLELVRPLGYAKQLAGRAQDLADLERLEADHGE